MVAWAALLKAGLPYVADIVATRLPAFTRRQGETNDAKLTAQQIAELQEAAQQQAGAIKTLAERLQEMTQAIEAGAREQENVIGALRVQVADLMRQREELQQQRDALHRRIEAARWASLIAFGTAFLALSLAVLGVLL